MDKFKYTPAMLQWLSENIPGKTFHVVMPIFNARFGSAVTTCQLKHACNAHHIHSGIKGGSSHKKKGKRIPIGAERIMDKKAGTVYIKISDHKIPGGYYRKSGTWKTKQAVVWEAAHGAVPKNHYIIFADQNKLNFELDNLLLVSKREFFHINKNGLQTNNAEITRVNVAIAKHELVVYDAIDRLTAIKKKYTPRYKYAQYKNKQRRNNENTN